MKDSKTNWIGALVGVAVSLTFVYFVARIASSGWNDGK